MSLSYSLSPHLLCGPHPLRPGRETLDSLLASSVTCFIDLTESGELPDYDFRSSILNRRSKIEDRKSKIRFPIADYSVPTIDRMTAILDALDAAISESHTVYLHCYGGRGRTGTVIGCWLVRHGMTGAQALARIAELRGDHDSPETDEQRAFVLNWEHFHREEREGFRKEREGKL